LPDAVELTSEAWVYRVMQFVVVGGRFAVIVAQVFALKAKVTA